MKKWQIGLLITFLVLCLLGAITAFAQKANDQQPEVKKTPEAQPVVTKTEKTVDVPPTVQKIPPAAKKVTEVKKPAFFQPADFKSLGVLVVKEKETVTFDTGTIETEPAVSGIFKGKGALGVSVSGVVQAAVFSFDSITIDKGAIVEVKGDRALVLLSKGSVFIDTNIDMSGKVGATLPWFQGNNNFGGAAGPGAEGGEHGKALKSNPPPPGGGDGGPGRKDNGEWGRGFGAGENTRCRGGSAGGGGAYGGAGGAASEGSTVLFSKTGPYAMAGGVVYGDAALTDLLGGSGGAGGSNDRQGQSASGGGGGGAIAIISLKDVIIGATGQINVAGGPGAQNQICGGGGSGGAILLVAPSISLTEGAVLNAHGGAGGDAGPNVVNEIKPGNDRRNQGSGGGGGGGRVALYSKDDFGTKGDDKIETTVPKGVTIAGGKGGTAAKDGADGTFYDGSWPELK